MSLDATELYHPFFQKLKSLEWLDEAQIEEVVHAILDVIETKFPNKES